MSGHSPNASQPAEPDRVTAPRPPAVTRHGPVVWNQLGDAAADRIATEVPTAIVHDVDPLHPTRPGGPAADVIFARPLVGVTGPARDAMDASWAAGVPWVHVAATGIDLVPRRLLLGRTAVTGSAGVSAHTIAEFALTMILAAEKDVPRIWDRSVARADFALGSLEDRTVGVVGFGAIGRRVAAMARAFDARVLATRRSPLADPGADGIALVPIEDVLRQADHLVLAVPATPETRGMIGRRALAMVRPGLHIVNVARGELIDHDALVDALAAGAVGRASLDVTEPEPLPEGHALLGDPRVRISSHLAWMSDRAQGVAIERFIANLHRWMDGRDLEGLVDPERGY